MKPNNRPRPRGSLAAIAAGLLTAAAVLILAAPGARAAQVLSGAGSNVTVGVNQGSLVRLAQPASTVFIADPEIADIQVKSPRLIYLLGKKPGRTTLFAVDEEERVLANMDVAVHHDIGRLREAVRSLYPNAEINVASIEQTVVLEGVVGSAAASDTLRRVAAQFVGKDTEIINRIGIDAPTQVNLRVRVAEISREVEKQLGINWDLVGNIAGAGIGFFTFNPFIATGTRPDRLLLDFSAGKWDINVMLDVLSQEGLVSLLAEPNLTALTGETASFLAGGEFPILVPQGDNQVTIEFKKFGVSLAFTPTIIDNTRINLHVRPEVSQLTNEGAISLPLGFDETITVPALKTRRAETTIELGSGQSFAIGGLLSNDSVHDIKKFPGLGDIPVVGRLFSSDAFLRKESELVIIVTPYVVRPSSNKPAAPTDGFVAPNDGERLFPNGPWRQARQPGPVSTVGPDGTRVYGPVGFALD